MINKEYLGDGVYVCIEAGMIKLTTEDGIQVTNIIYLEDFVYNALVKWFEQNIRPQAG